jgi:hypothetical protein
LCVPSTPTISPRKHPKMKIARNIATTAPTLSVPSVSATDVLSEKDGKQTLDHCFHKVLEYRAQL